MLKKNNINEENTIFVIFSDHGEELYDRHGEYIGTTGHGTSLFNEQIRVPLIMSFPKYRYHERYMRNVGLIDIAPSILSYLKYEYQELAQFAGKSIYEINDPKKLVNNYIYCGGNRNRAVVINDRWKYYFHQKRSNNKKESVFSKPGGETKIYYDEELFDLENDNKETNDVLNKNPKITTELRQLLKRYIHNNKKLKSLSIKDAGIDWETRKQLRSLGYIE